MKKFTACALKVTAVCNLSCTYCYMFNLEDRTFQRMPPQMSLETALRFLDRLVEHLADAERPTFAITLHGGEPTMWPIDHLAAFLDRVETLRSRGLALAVTMQTNAYRLPPGLPALLAAHRVGLGISLDGPAHYNDRVRLTHAGHGSYDRVMATVRAILDGGHGAILGGFLTVAQPAIPPAEYLEWIERLPVKRVDVLWPIEFHHRNPPWGDGDRAAYELAPRYGRWFADLFDLWFSRDNPDHHIRLFYQIIERRLGGRHHIDALVNDELSMFGVNTDGSFEYPDYFRAFRDGGAATRFTVAGHAIGVLVEYPVFAYCLSLGEHLPADCAGCPSVDVCGGGFLPGRMGDGAWPPRRKSILCADQLYFFSRVERTLRPSLARAAART